MEPCDAGPLRQPSRRGRMSLFRRDRLQIDYLPLSLFHALIFYPFNHSVPKIEPGVTSHLFNSADIPTQWRRQGNEANEGDEIWPNWASVDFLSLCRISPQQSIAKSVCIVSKVPLITFSLELLFQQLYMFPFIFQVTFLPFHDYFNFCLTVLFHAKGQHLSWFPLVDIFYAMKLYIRYLWMTLGNL